MKPALSKAEKILLLSVSFTLVLLTIRVLRSHNTSYMFYPWNLLLAVVPIYFSRKLTRYKSVNWKSICLIAAWLLFFPNAPYVITDIFHFHQRPEAPIWYDLILVLSAAWNGLIAGFISLMQVDKFMAGHTSKKLHAAFICAFLFAASCGIYLGRFLRFNSWDIVKKPGSLAEFAFAYVFQPTGHIKAWAFSVLCTILLLLIYYTIKNLPALVTPAPADEVTHDLYKNRNPA
jgi:uncharacterized membrane protein